MLLLHSATRVSSWPRSWNRMAFASPLLWSLGGIASITRLREPSTFHPRNSINAYLKDSGKDSLILSQRDMAILNEFDSLFALIAEVCTKAQADQAASVSLVAPSLLEINFDLQAEQTSLKYAGSLCKALLKSMQARFGGLLPQFELGMGDAQKPRSTCELYSDPIFLLTRHS